MGRLLDYPLHRVVKSMKRRGKKENDGEEKRKRPDVEVVCGAQCECSAERLAPAM